MFSSLRLKMIYTLFKHKTFSRIIFLCFCRFLKINLLLAGFKINWLYQLQSNKIFPQKKKKKKKKESVLGMTLNCIWQSGSNSGDLGSVVYHFIALLPGLLWSGLVIPIYSWMHELKHSGCQFIFFWYLTDFMIENRLTCLNTNYQKREGKLWTYTYANNSQVQIDYIFINKKWKNSAMNCEAYSSFKGVSSDHRIVTVKLWLSLRKNTTRTATTKHYDWALLNNRDIRDICIRIKKQIRDTTREDRKRHPKWQIWEFC